MMFAGRPRLSLEWPFLCIAVAWAAFASAQNNVPSTSSAPSIYPGSGTNRSQDFGFPGIEPSTIHRQMLSRRDENYRHMQENAARLVVLTHDLQESIRMHGPEAADAKRLDEIAKLSRAVRDGMRQ